MGSDLVGEAGDVLDGFEIGLGEEVGDDGDGDGFDEGF